MDVYGHLEKREQKIKALMNDNKTQNEPLSKPVETISPITDSSLSQPIQTNKEKDTFDLQKELEKKFDELFGSSDD